MPSLPTRPPRRRILRLKRIVSGGQTGVDRAALDAAIQAGVEHGGWCPLGRLAEDGPIPPEYQLAETDQADYRFRTECNVVDSDGTLILYHRQLSGGTLLTRRLVERHQRPCFLADLAGRVRAVDILGWLKEYGIGTLNVAGPRESTQPGVYRRAKKLLGEVLAAVPPKHRKAARQIDGDRHR